MMNRLAMRYHGLRSRLRARLLNWRRGVEIAAPSYIARTAKIDLFADGFVAGGNVRIGSGSRLSDGAIIAPYGGSITIGRNIYIGPYSILYGHGGLIVGDNVLIAGQTIIIPSNHTFSNDARPIREQGATNIGIVIKDDVWIGCGACVLDGVTIGQGCVIGAGSVVTKSIPDFSVANGVPARVIGTRGA